MLCYIYVYIFGIARDLMAKNVTRHKVTLLSVRASTAAAPATCKYTRLYLCVYIYTRQGARCS